MVRWLWILIAVGFLTACATAPHDSDAPLTGAQLWDRLAPDSVVDEIPEAEVHLGQLFERPLSAESCTEHRAGLAHYLNRIPVDLSYRKAAIECAMLLNEPDWQQRAQRHFDALLDYAGSGGKGQSPWQPMPVLHVQDVYTLIETRGLALNWMRYLSHPTARHLLLEASLTDAGGREQRYYFDLLEPLLRLYSDNPALAFPSGRRELMFTSLEADVFNGDALALTGYLYMDIESGIVNPNSAQRALSQAWEAGLPGGGITLAEFCIGNPESNCATDALEQLIADLTELDLGEAWALAAAHRIVKQNADLDDAEVIESLARAAALTASDRMLFYTADVLTNELGPTDPRIEPIRDELLRRAADQGHGIANLRLALMYSGQQDADSKQAFEHHLDLALSADSPHALMIAAFHHGIGSVQGRAYLLEAAKREMPAAQFLSAIGMFDDRRTASHARALSLLREAAYGGHTDAMRILGLFALGDNPEQPDWEQAHGWFYSGWVFGDPESAAFLAALLSVRPELAEDPDATFMITRSLYVEAGAEAALRVSEILLETQSFNQDAQNGIALLKRMSDEGINEASFTLAERFRFGDRVDQNISQAELWYRRAHKQGHAEALFEHAGMVFFTLNEHARGLSLFEQAIDAGHAMSANDLAWILCTGESGVPLDSARGQQVIDALFARLDEPHPYQYSTKAACHAARGEFDLALKFHRIALKRTQTDDPNNESVIEEMRARLMLYEAGQPYIWQP